MHHLGAREVAVEDGPFAGQEIEKSKAEGQKDAVKPSRKSFEVL